MKNAVDDAKEAMRELFAPTPLQFNDFLSGKYDAQIYLKREDLTLVRSYKIRGAFNFFRKALRVDQPPERFVCASAGNHAQGFAYVCRHFEKSGVVYMPVTTPPQKIAKTKAFGGAFIEVRLVGDIFDECYDAAKAYAESDGAMMVPPFDHADIIEGQATVASEIVAQLPKGIHADLMIIPVGGGGLSAGMTTYLRDQYSSQAFLFCEPAGAPSLKESLKAGHRIKLKQVDNFVDGAAVAEIGEQNFEALKQFGADQVMLIAENAVCVTISELLNIEGIVLEPAGALAIAALEDIGKKVLAGKTVVVIVSGGNFDFERLPDVKERAMRHLGLKKYFVLRLAQRPGALKDFLNMLGPEDDIARFEYLKKSARNFGSILIGIETRNSENFDRLTKAFDDAGLRYEDITDNEILASLII
ncbi:MAG: threonine ammonia-lyase IlvA [Rhizobiaceae bacterium]|nr:threonine ammonia-lyase IlvA [Rhizobiaceae bacterium]